MNYKVVESREIVWCDSDDRYILIIKENDAVVGINWMQGEDLENFKECYNYVDEDFTDFFNATNLYLSGDLIGRINSAIWAYFEYRNLRDEREYKNNNK